MHFQYYSLILNSTNEISLRVLKKQFVQNISPPVLILLYPDDVVHHLELFLKCE